MKKIDLNRINDKESSSKEPLYRSPCLVGAKTLFEVGIRE